MNISVFIEFFRKGHLLVAFLLFLLLPLARIDLHYFFGERIVIAYGAVLFFLAILLYKKRHTVVSLPVSFFDVCVGSFYLCYIISFLTAQSVPGAVVPLLMEMPFLFVYIFLRVLTHRLRQQGEVQTFAAIVLAGASLLSLWGLLQYFFGFDVTPELRQLFASHHFPVLASMGNPNFLSEYLILALPLSLAGALHFKRLPFIIVFGILFMAQGLCIFLTYSRLAWALLALFMLLSLFIARERRRPLFLIYCVFGLAALSIFALHHSGGKKQAQRVIKNFTVESPFRERRIMYHASLEMARESSLFGVGPGAFGRLYPRYRSSAEKSLDSVSPDRDVVDLKHAHNDFIEIAVDNGYASLFFYLLLMGGGLVKGLAFAWSRRGNGEALIGLIPLLALFYSFWSFPFFLPFSRILILFSFAYLSRERFSLSLTGPAKAAVAAMLLVPGMVLFAVQGRYLHAVYYYNKGLDLFEVDSEKSRRALEKSISIFPCEGMAWYSLGSLLLREDGEEAKGIRSMERSLLFYAHGDSYFLLARGYRELDKREKAIFYYRRYLEIFPLDRVARKEMKELQQHHDYKAEK